MRTICSFFFMLSLGATAAAAAPTATETPSEAVLRDSATRAMRDIDRTVATWHTQRTCFSCHHQSLPIAAALVARSRGIPLDETLLRKNVAVATAMMGSLARQVQGYQQIDPGTELGTLLSTADLVGMPRSAASTATALTLASHQLDDGSWSTLDARPPQSYSPITTTAFAVRALSAYMPAERSADLAQRIARARAWLSAAQARDTEELTYRLYGLAWARADKSAIETAASALSARPAPRRRLGADFDSTKRRLFDRRGPDRPARSRAGADERFRVTPGDSGSSSIIRTQTARGWSRRECTSRTS